MKRLFIWDVNSILSWPVLKIVICCVLINLTCVVIRAFMSFGIIEISWLVNNKLIFGNDCICCVNNTEICEVNNVTICDE